MTKSAADKKEALEKAAKEANKDIKPEDLKKKVDEDPEYKKIVEGDAFKTEKETQEKFGKLREGATQGALLNMAIFPAIMLVGYVLLLLYFKSKGGYKPVVLGAGGH